MSLESKINYLIWIFFVGLLIRVTMSLLEFSLDRVELGINAGV